MLGKILFTLAVIVVVVVLFRFLRARRAVADSARETSQESSARSLPPRVLQFALLGGLLAAGAAWVAHHYREQNRIVQVRVISPGGEVAEYRARKKSTGARGFTDITGARITPAAGERIEIR